MSTPTRRGRRKRRQGQLHHGAERSDAAGPIRLRRKTADRPAKLNDPRRPGPHDAAPGAVDSPAPLRPPMRGPASRSTAVRGPSLTGMTRTPSLTRSAGDPSVQARGGRNPGVHRGLRGDTPRASENVFVTARCRTRQTITIAQSTAKNDPGLPLRWFESMKDSMCMGPRMNSPYGSASSSTHCSCHARNGIGASRRVSSLPSRCCVRLLGSDHRVTAFSAARLQTYKVSATAETPITLGTVTRTNL